MQRDQTVRAVLANNIFNLFKHMKIYVMVYVWAT